MATSSSSTEQAQQEQQGAVVKFVPFSSSVESAFWVRYCREKLEKIQLNEEPVAIVLSYAAAAAARPRLQCQNNSLLTTDKNDAAAAATTSTNNECVSVSGSLIGFNTLESFQTSDKNELLRNAFCSKFFPSHSGKGDDDDDDRDALDALTSTVLLTFADLKNHKVVYWFGMPALVPQAGKSIRALQQQNLCDAWSAEQCQQLTVQIEAMRRQSMLKSSQAGTSGNGGLVPYFIYSNKKASCVVPLSKESYYASNRSASDGDDDDSSNIVFGFFDPTGYTTSSSPQSSSSSSSTSPEQQTMMGWPMRNLIAYLCFHLDLGGTSVQVLSYRPKVLRRLSVEETSSSTAPSDAVLVESSANDDHSVLLTVQVPRKDEYEAGDPDPGDDSAAGLHPKYKVVGWELNARSKPGPRSVNLRPLLDPQHLAIQASDLNLKLMKWRMIPNLNVDLLQSSNVLLIGAGTLGCSVARVLLAWGVRHFKIVDYGKVSYSNPVRQSLFTLEDCHADGGSGRPKAAAAAEALKTIAADVHSEGITLSIPMPGHPESEEAIRKSVETLDSLVQETDAVFLLTDTRESRWLPTVMAAAHDKMLINAALGLDSWLVMRHGGGCRDVSSVPEGTEKQRFGCYFCSDVVAPENSTKNRTLDQQCTVTRPGLAPIASSMAVEVMVSLLHHPAKLAAPAPTGRSSNFSPTVANEDAASPLGVIPHQIRGSLVSYTMMTPTIPAFKHCTGCSASVVDAYLKDKVGTVVKSCQTTSGSYLEDISGLTAFRAEAAEKLAEMEGWDEDDDDDDE